MSLPLTVLLNEIRRTDDQTGREEGGVGAVGEGHVGVGVEYCPHCSERRVNGRAEGGLKGEAVGVSSSGGGGGSFPVPPVGFWAA